MELAGLAPRAEPKMTKLSKTFIEDSASRYPYVHTMSGQSDAVLVPNPDIHCFADDLPR